MTVRDLKKMTEGVDDDMPVLISLTGEFDGVFVAPCMEESGVSELGIFENEEDEKEAELLNKPVSEKSFLLVRCGFFQPDHVNPESN